MPEFEPALAVDDATGLVSEESIAAMRSAVDTKWGKTIERAFWVETVDYLDELYKVPKAEEKNSASLSEKPSPDSGSPAQSGGSESSDGASTSAPSEESTSEKSNIEPIPEAASDTIHRYLVNFCMRTRYEKVERFPDGRSLVEQPIRLLNAINIVRAEIERSDPRK